MSVRGISTPFGELFPTSGQVRTCSSAVRHSAPEGAACDLHALGTPPALILSQDQTRQKMVKLDSTPSTAPSQVWWPGRRLLHTSVGKVRGDKKTSGLLVAADSASCHLVKQSAPKRETSSFPTTDTIACWPQRVKQQYRVWRTCRGLSLAAVANPVRRQRGVV